MEPSSSLLVFALAALALWIGFQLLRTRDQQKSRFWWGLSLILWGLGACMAGVSYQAFAYEIKAVGRNIVAWTSWWEVMYLLFSAASVNAMMAGVAYSSCSFRLQRIVLWYATLNTAVYLGLCMAGAFMPNIFLVSFELMVGMTTPGYLIFFVVNAREFKRSRNILEQRLMVTWLALGLVMGIYFAYLGSGSTETLWKNGWWFSANDVLHAEVILWMLWIHKKVAPLLKDRGCADQWHDELVATPFNNT
jgi:type IV secretory pathway VirB3-like protein